MDDHYLDYVTKLKEKTPYLGKLLDDQTFHVSKSLKLLDIFTFGIHKDIVDFHLPHP
jgi:hypothetical protein